MTAAGQWAWLAQIRRTQGRKGEVFAEILTDFPERFAERKQLWLLAQETVHRAGTRQGAERPQNRIPIGLNPRGVELVAHWRHKDGVVLHFAGVDSISEAEQLIGLVVAIPWIERAPLGENEAYIGDLIGCVLVDVAGDEPMELGPIEDVDLSAGPAPLLVIEGRRGEILVPFAKSYLRRLDLESKRVEMELPAGLADLNDGSQ
jgi:16S rRNA processing protein RimM